MTLKQFTQKQNIEMLWDVISDEEIFRFLTPDIQHKISQLFINNIQGFFESEKNKSNSLVDINKKYILLILNHIRKTYPYQPSKIKIYNEAPTKELITYEEIQNDRKTQFEQEFNKRQTEFEDSINIKTPPALDFKDKEADRPIKEMDKLVKEMLAQRNYEVEQINRTYNNYNQIDNWLKPQDTSLKGEKFESNKDSSEKLEQQNNRFKFLNNLDTNLSNNNNNNNNSPTNNKKNVSFSNTDEIKTFTDIDDEDDNNIFSRLKKVNRKEDLILETNTQKNMNQENRIINLERNMNNLNEKLDKILDLLSKKI